MKKTMSLALLALMGVPQVSLAFGSPDVSLLLCTRKLVEEARGGEKAAVQDAVRFLETGLVNAVTSSDVQKALLDCKDVLKKTQPSPMLSEAPEKFHAFRRAELAAVENTNAPFAVKRLLTDFIRPTFVCENVGAGAIGSFGWIGLSYSAKEKFCGGTDGRTYFFPEGGLGWAGGGGAAIVAIVRPNTYQDDFDQRDYAVVDPRGWVSVAGAVGIVGAAYAEWYPFTPNKPNDYGAGISVPTAVVAVKATPNLCIPGPDQRDYLALLARNLRDSRARVP
jgi:hypothetical protein